jgi:hypothetical protein
MKIVAATRTASTAQTNRVAVSLKGIDQRRSRVIDLHPKFRTYLKIT